MLDVSPYVLPTPLETGFDQALPAYRECLGFSKNPDMLVATTNWLYMTLRRLNRPEDARALLQQEATIAQRRAAPGPSLRCAPAPPPGHAG